MNAAQLQGSMVALVTPMHADGAVDWAALKHLVDWHIENRTDVLVAVGTTGESATLDTAEHIEVIAKVVEQAAARVPVIAGTGANATAEAIELTREAQKVGADAALLVAPYYNKPTQEGIYQHYKTIAEAVDIPQILYNVPGRTIVDISDDVTVRLSDIDNIIAIKDATGDVARGQKLIARLADRMSVLSGDDATALELIKVGAKGNISVTANVAPKPMAQVFAAALAGDFSTAERIHADIAHLHSILFCESSPIPVKFALQQMGMIQEGIRLPMTWLADAYHTPVLEALAKAGIQLG